MGYKSNDLGIFVPVRDKQRLEGTAYFELHPGELPKRFACWLPGSLFVKDAAFDFFVTSFEHANPKFDYFAFERFSRAQIDVLLGELATFTSELVPECSREVVFSRYSSIFPPDIWDDVGTEILRSSVVRAANEMTSFIRGSCDKDECLWVLGM